MNDEDQPRRETRVRTLSDVEWVAMKFVEAAVRHGGSEALNDELAERAVATARRLLDAAGRGRTSRRQRD